MTYQLPKETAAEKRLRRQIQALPETYRQMLVEGIELRIKRAEQAIFAQMARADFEPPMESLPPRPKPARRKPRKPPSRRQPSRPRRGR